MKAILIGLAGSSSALRWLVFACPPRRALDPSRSILSSSESLLGQHFWVAVGQHYCRIVSRHRTPPACRATCRRLIATLLVPLFCARGCVVHHTNVDFAAAA